MMMTTTDSTPLNKNRPLKNASSLPRWFNETFKHVDKSTWEVLQRLWSEEPALRTFTLLLDTLHPDNHRLRACPHCGNHAIQLSDDTGKGTPRGECSACRKNFSLTTGTPFYRIHRANYHGLYGTAFMLWGPWTPYYAWRVAGCTDTKQFSDFRRRLAPLFDEIIDMPLMSYPAYRLGFTPGQQGIRCLRCGADDLFYRKRHNPANPTLQCNGCGYHFVLHASRRHLLPLPPELKCPSCHSQELNRKTVDAEGRGRYRCRACGRHFVENPKKYQPSAQEKRYALHS